MVFRDAVSKLETFDRDFEPCVEVQKLVPFLPKSIKLGQMSNFSVIFLSLISKSLKLAPVSWATSTTFPGSLISLREGGKMTDLGNEVGATSMWPIMHVSV